MIEPLSHRVRGDGVDLHLFEWPGEGRPIFLAHATGFHARCWDGVVRHLPGRHVFALDMRGHGRSEKPEPPYPWDNFGNDVAAVAEAIGLDGAVGVGHSKGGHAVTRAAGLRAGTFSALLLVDPVIMRREMYATRPAMSEGDHFAARRRNEWASAAEMYERFAGRPPFNSWQPDVLRDYCEYGLLPNPDGEGYVLACPPRIEAATYAGSSGTDIYDTIEALEIPVRVMRAKERTEQSPSDMSSSPTAPDLARHFRQGVDIPLPHLTHFIPMEAPALVARHILELCG